MKNCNLDLGLPWLFDLNGRNIIHRNWLMLSSTRWLWLPSVWRASSSLFPFIAWQLNLWSVILATWVQFFSHRSDESKLFCVCNMHDMLWEMPLNIWCPSWLGRHNGTIWLFLYESSSTLTFQNRQVYVNKICYFCSALVLKSCTSQTITFFL